MNAADRRHLDAVAALGCCICGCEAEIHHVRREGAPRDHKRVIPLCPRHHRTGGQHVAVHAGRESWETNHGTEAHYVLVVAKALALGGDA
jgi:hypothetical protein